MHFQVDSFFRSQSAQMIKKLLAIFVIFGKQNFEKFFIDNTYSQGSLNGQSVNATKKSLKRGWFNGGPGEPKILHYARKVAEYFYVVITDHIK